MTVKQLVRVRPLDVFPHPTVQSIPNGHLWHIASIIQRAITPTALPLYTCLPPCRLPVLAPPTLFSSHLTADITTCERETFAANWFIKRMIGTRCIWQEINVSIFEHLTFRSEEEGTAALWWHAFNCRFTVWRSATLSSPAVPLVTGGQSASLRCGRCSRL